MKAKPYFTGERFGYLTLLGKSGRDSKGLQLWKLECDCGNLVEKPRCTFVQLWRLRCDCGNIVERARESFERKGLASCGHARQLGLIDNKRRPLEIKGQRFGNLVAIQLTGRSDSYGSIDVFWRRKLESQGGFLYNASGIKKELGGTMTDATLDNYPVIETQGINMMPVRAKRFKFKRC